MASLIRFHYDPFTGLNHFLDDAFNARSWPSPLVNPSQRFNSFRPRMDMKESEDANAMIATFELPGLKPEDVSIDVQQNRLTVSGEFTSSDSQECDGYAVRERRSGKFSRTLRLPFGTKPEDVIAKLENGLLTVTFPKASSEQQPQRISVE